MLRSRWWSVVVGLLIMVGGALIGLNATEIVYAGLHDDETGARYVEIWADHAWFTGGCDDHETSGWNWYLEPCGGRDNPKTVTVRLPGDLSKVTKIELYADLWNTRTPQDIGFAINDGPSRTSNVASLYGRVPMIMELPKSEFTPGENTIAFWYNAGGWTYHVHDVSVRLYYDPANPPLTGLGSLNAELLNVGDGVTTLPANAGGSLNIDGDQLTFTVGNVSPDVDFVEIYGYYDGYDEDNVGGSLDWHSRGRHNCHQGGTSACPGDPETGLLGTIDHIGTIDASAGVGPYTLTWDAEIIEAQEGVRFKLRAVDIDVDVTGDGQVNRSDNAENVRNAPGGVSAPFALERSRAVVGFTIPDFQSAFLQRPNTAPDAPSRCANTEIERDWTINLPPDTTGFDQAVIVGSHYNNPQVSINGNAPFFVFTSGQDFYALARRDFSVTQLQVGDNTLTYISGYQCPNGIFVEPPGPMIVLKRTANPGPDATAPWAHGVVPADGSVDLAVNTTLAVQIYDSNSGVDRSSIQMQVNTGSGYQIVTPTISGGKYNYKLAYDPPVDFPYNRAISVKVDARDLAGNPVSHTWSFTTIPDFAPADVASDDFNACQLDTSRWQFVNPAGDGLLVMNGDAVELTAPEGGSHDLWNFNKNAPRLIQPIANGNFDIEVKFDSIFSEAMANVPRSVQMQGLIAGVNTSGGSGDFLRYDAEFFNGGIRLYWQIFENGIGTSLFGSKYVGGQTPPAYLRVKREAYAWTLYATHDPANWGSPVATFTSDIEVREVGVFGGNAGENPEHTAIIDYFFNRNDPISPEDPAANALPVTVVGQGVVDKNPSCGNPVTLTASPDPGWEFGGWSGSLNSSNPVETVAFNRGDAFTATFNRSYYTLDIAAVDKNGAPTDKGQVVATPPADPLGYTYGETATLTATAVAGWVFAGWQGDLSGTQTPATLTMESDRSIQGVFRQLVTLTTTPVGDGAVTVDPASPDGVYVDGDVVTVTALPDVGKQFLGWTGDATGPDSPLDVTMDEDKSLYAHFLGVETQGTGNVAIASITPITPGALEVVLEATPAPGWGLAAWRVDGVDREAADRITVTVDQSTNVTALFKRTYTLSIAADANGDIQATPGKSVYFEDEVVRLTPIPNEGYAFVGWLGDLADRGSEAPVDLVMDSDKQVGARFVPGYGVTVYKVGAGAVTLIPEEQPYVLDEVVTLTATPDQGWEFSNWSGDLVSAANPAQVTINANKMITATFTAIPYTLEVQISPEVGVGGRVNVSRPGPYTYGDEVTLQAIADDGWRFVRWSGDVSGSDPQIAVRIDGDKQVVAHFSGAKAIYLPVISRSP